ncbi:MAG: MBL fold metallo-hydrolase [Betaproteobacteria bacterium]|nr:MBL fold metallo-hydrolase [Betaproteobacteria bacterium]
MLVRFWGTRGSIPVALTSADIRRKVETALSMAIAKGVNSTDKLRSFIDNDLDFSISQTYGGQSPCVEIETGRAEYLVCDMGSGARAFGGHIMSAQKSGPISVNVIMSHVHWDHIMGFPFFAPAYVPGTRIRIFGCHDVIEKAFRLQQSAPCFPVDFSRLSADIEFVKLEAGRAADIAGYQVTPKLQRHTGDSYGYRFERDGKAIVYSTDSEHKLEDPADTESFIEFFRNADLVIFDAMYSLLDAVSVKEDWGHSSNMVGVELAQLANVRHLCMFHHEPAFDDERIQSVLNETIRFEQLTRGDRPLIVSAAFDGMEIEV